jgi:hypothetical protein
MRSILSLWLSFADAKSGQWLPIKLACSGSGGGAYLACDTLAALRATDSGEHGGKHSHFIT